MTKKKLVENLATRSPTVHMQRHLNWTSWRSSQDLSILLSTLQEFEHLVRWAAAFTTNSLYQYINIKSRQSSAPRWSSNSSSKGKQGAGCFSLRLSMTRQPDVVSLLCGQYIPPAPWLVTAYTKPFDQTRDAAQQEEEGEHADSIWKKLRLQECKKSFARSTKMDLMRLLKELE